MIKRGFYTWLTDDTNAEMWYGQRSFTSSEKRILITQWAGVAYRKLCEAQYDSTRWRYFQKTGCLLTANGEDDALVTPEGLPNYVVQRPSPVRPLPFTPTMLDLHYEDDALNAGTAEPEMVEGCVEIMDDFHADFDGVEIVGPDEYDDGNVFDMFDSFN